MVNHGAASVASNMKAAAAPGGAAAATSEMRNARSPAALGGAVQKRPVAEEAME